MFLLMLPAILNGYPIVNPDVATYIRSGFQLDTPYDRPITYGLLLRIFSMGGTTMWTVIVWQAFIVNLLITNITKRVCNHPENGIISFIIIAMLSVTTSLSWIVSELIPDVYTPIALLAMASILLKHEKKYITFLLYILFFVAVATHISHLLIYVSLLLLLLFTSALWFSKEKLKSARYKIAGMICLCGVSIIIMGSAMSKSKHIFLTASLLDKGVLKKYLDDKCGTVNYNLCKYKNSLPADPNAFLWNDDSPLAKEGGWKETKDEYTKINDDILFHAPYNTLFIQKSIFSTAQQLITFGIGDGNFAMYTPDVQDEIGLNISPKEKNQHLQSLQNSGELLKMTETPNTIISIVLAVSIIATTLLIIAKKKLLSRQFYMFLFTCVSAIVINAADCASFAQVNGRYGCRVMWLIPFCLLIALFSKKNSINTGSPQL